MEYVDYHAYIQSDEWKFKSRAMKWLAGYRCQICNSGEIRLETHHRTYRNLGNESPQDLTVLCEDCHELYSVHDKISKQQQPVNYYMVDTEILIKIAESLGGKVIK